MSTQRCLALADSEPRAARQDRALGSIPPANSFDIVTTLLSEETLLECPSNTSFAGNGLSPSQFYMLDYHRDRMLAAIHAFEWPGACQPQINSLMDHLQAHIKGAVHYNGSSLRLRLALSIAGNLSVSSMETDTVPLTSLFPRSLSSLVDHLLPGSVPNFRVYISRNPTEPSLFTSHKTSWRQDYDDLRAMLPAKGSGSGFPEILLFNYRDEIMEGSICTPYFLRGGQWITPHISSGGNIGTTRRYALEQRLCKQGIVMRDSIKAGEKVILSNGVRGFGWGIVENLMTK